LCWGAGSLAKGHRDFAVPFSFFRQTSARRGETSVRIDLNADVGEASTAEGKSAEIAVLSAVTSVNIACGAHAGDLDTMHELVAAAAAAGLAIGAHPGYADRDGRGRREHHRATSEIATLVREQVNLLTTVARAHRVELRHVKPHGALYNQAATDPLIARAIAEGVRQSSPALRLVGLAGSELIRAGRAAGLATTKEALADRAYRRDGTLVPRTDVHAVHTESAAVVAQALSIAIRHRVQLADGHRLDIDADTLCLHGDTPGAADLARKIREALAEAGVEVVRLS
jgi:5-oxoprolinase (ATP-hydrolysing) subunit A